MHNPQFSVSDKRLITTAVCKGGESKTEKGESQKKQYPEMILKQAYNMCSLYEAKIES